MAVRVPIGMRGDGDDARTLVDAGSLGAKGTVEARFFAAGAGARLRHGVESALVVLAGAGDWRGDGHTWSLRQGDGVYTPAGGAHEWTATSDDTCLLVVRADAPREDGPPEPRRFAATDDSGEGVLGSVGGFVDMGVRWLATTETVGARRLVVATSTFTPGGSHGLHRHHNADEFFLVVSGSGAHLTETGEVALVEGDLVFVPANEWHGYRTDEGTVTRAVYGYLGAGSLEQAGYELDEAEVPA